jgi:hypothetical protein
VRYEERGQGYRDIKKVGKHWYSLLLLGYKPVQHVTVLNTVGSCIKVVSFIILHHNIVNLWDHCHICGLLLTKMSLCGA